MEQMLPVLGVIVVVLVAWSVARAADTPAGSKAFGMAEPAIWQKWIFVAWTIAGPLYLLLDWNWHGSGLDQPKLSQFQYRQKLISDLWAAGAVMCGVFWGLKKFKE